MKRILTSICLLLAAMVTLSAQQKPDTLYISDITTTTVLLKNSITYAEISNTDVIIGQLSEENSQIIALRAYAPFQDRVSLTIQESNGDMKTFTLLYRKINDFYLYDYKNVADSRSSSSAEPVAVIAPNAAGSGREMAKRKDYQDKGRTGGSNLRYANAPTLEDIYRKPQELFHIGQKNSKVFFCCANLYTYSDITYVTLIIRNGSNISYETGNASFTIESRKKAKRTVPYQEPVIAKSHYGDLTAEPGGEAKICYALPKLTLSKDQCICIYLNEINGERNFILKLIDDDINNAKMPM